MVNDFRFSYPYFRNRLYPPSRQECESLAGDPRYCFGVGGTLTSFFGGLTIGNNANVPQDRHPRTYQFTDNVSRTLGMHRLRFGGNWEHIFSHGSWNRNFAGTFGVFSPTTIAASNPALYNALPASLKLGYTGRVATFDELLQLPMTGALTIGIGDPIQPVKQNFDALARNNHIRFYARDNWQLRKSFTLNYGLAWSWEDNMEDINRWNRFSGYTLNAATGVATPTRNPVLPVCTSAQAIDPKALCSTNIIYYGSPSILSRYSALQIKVDRRFSQGFLLTGAYALQRYTTYAPANGATPNSFTDSTKNFGLSAASPKHQFTFSGIWDLPDVKNGNRLVRGALSGWQLSTIWQMRSRDLSTVQLGTFDTDGDGTFIFLLPGTEINSFGRGLDANDIRSLVDAYNASVPAPKDTQLAQIGRDKRDVAGAAYPYIVLPDNFSSGDSFIAHDLRVTRTVSITEKVKLNLIAEGFNILNIANLGGFSGSLASAAYIRPTATAAGRPNPNNLFGQPTSRVSPIFGTGGPRAFQFAARLSF